MPIYEYECQECGFRHEALQKVTDDPLVTCPSCQADALKKLVSAAGFRLSGSGWYETDFKSDKQKNLAKKDSEKSKSSNGDKKQDTGKKSTEKAAAKSVDSSKKSSGHAS